jgi:hypothetical protein
LYVFSSLVEEETAQNLIGGIFLRQNNWQYYSTLMAVNPDAQMTSRMKLTVSHRSSLSEESITKNMFMKHCLIVYVYFEASIENKENVMTFLDYGVIESSIVDYLLVINGNHSLSLPHISNLNIIQRENTCYDIRYTLLYVLNNITDIISFI